MTALHNDVPNMPQIGAYTSSFSSLRVDIASAEASVLLAIHASCQKLEVIPTKQWCEILTVHGPRDIANL
jgi:hypothetical protein